ncbi:uncharacterized protein FMAN_02561 [Fusarium mangiferae]|uniref:Uncharacterized protein n=1 Tax=Fusarium mangiferae TaxID=192010 RepID=A0A1L7TMD7_FUSMA|nr:uncharacterized protein FMAN_02561 [Fusarium mangiferae]CVK99830.1 uncharacterized protein FMAN_02561 [Fusarium mangiferae]
MSWLPKNLYPEGSGIDSKTIEDIVVQDIIKNEMTRREQLDLATALTVMLVAEAADETTTSYEYDDDEEYERRKIINKVEEEEEVDDDDEEEDEEDEEDEEEDDEYTDVYDSTEDGLYDAFDDVSSYGSLRFLVLDMPVENAEPEPITRKRALSREETPCPPPRNPAKRQKMDTSAVSEPPKPQASGTKEPASPSARPEWQQYGGKEIPKSLIPRIVRSALLGTPLHALHPEAQSFLMAINFDLPGSKELACAVIDMGLRFSKTATRSEYKIVFKELLESHGRISMYNSAHNNFEAQHRLFWNKVKKHTGKPVPPERLVEHQARKRRRIAESYARNKAIHAEENAKKLALQKQLKEQFAKKMSEGEAKKLPLDERVKKWLKEIVPVQKK